MTALGTASRALVLVLVGAVAACTPAARSPSGGGEARFGKVFAAALEAEQKDSASPTPWLDALDEAARDPGAPGAFALASASIDALVTLEAPGLDGGTAVAFRTRAGMATTVKRLEHAYAEVPLSSGGPPEALYVRGAIATVLHELAMYAGDIRAAEIWSERRGCASTASVYGPLDWTPLTGLAGPRRSRRLARCRPRSPASRRSRRRSRPSSRAPISASSTPRRPRSSTACAPSSSTSRTRARSGRTSR